MLQTPEYGFHKRKPWAAPVTRDNIDWIERFFRGFDNWLKRSKNKYPNTFGLTDDTYRAISHNFGSLVCVSTLHVARRRIVNLFRGWS